MFIKYLGTNIHALPHLPKHIDENAVKVLSPQDIQWLRPGWNEFPKSIWDQHKDHPQIKKMLKEGKPDHKGRPTKEPLIELMSEKVTFLEGKKKKTKVVGQDDSQIALEVFDEKRAIQIVKETHNRDLLQRWLDEENRGKVRRMIDKQLEPLLNTEDNEDGDDDSDDDAA